MNARGIPTTAYQVIHLLPKVGYTPWPGLMGGTWGGVPPSRGTRGPGLMGVPKVGYTPSRGYPPPARSDRGYPPSWTWLGYPPPGTDRWMDGQTHMKTLPSRCTTYVVSKYFKILISRAIYNFCFGPPEFEFGHLNLSVTGLGGPPNFLKLNDIPVPSSRWEFSFLGTSGYLWSGL